MESQTERFSDTPSNPYLSNPDVSCVLAMAMLWPQIRQNRPDALPLDIYTWLAWCIRAAATRAAAIRCACDGAIRSFINASTSAGAVSGDPALKGGAGLYSRRSWIASAVRACKILGKITRPLIERDHRWRTGSTDSDGGRRPRACRSAPRCERRERTARSFCSSASVVSCSSVWRRSH